MGRRLVKDSFRGWYNWESRFNAAARMSNAGLQTTKVKNQQESNRLGFAVKQLSKHKDFSERLAERDLKSLREEFSRMVAFGQVYKSHSFDRYDPLLKKGSGNPCEPKSSLDKAAANRKTSLNPLAISSHRKEGDVPWDITRQNISKVNGSQATQPPNQVRISTPVPTLKRLPSFGRLVSNITRKPSISETEVTSRLGSTRSVRGNSPPKSDVHHLEAIPEFEYKRIRKRMKTLPHKRDRTIFPGECKSTYEMRKFMEKEVEHLLYSWTPSGRREAKIEQIKAEAKMPILVQRTKSTSAILRDFRNYKQTEREEIVSV